MNVSIKSLETKPKVNDTTRQLKLFTTNATCIPYIRYIELDQDVLNNKFHCVRFLVFKATSYKISQGILRRIIFYWTLPVKYVTTMYIFLQMMKVGIKLKQFLKWTRDVIVYLWQSGRKRRHFDSGLFNENCYWINASQHERRGICSSCSSFSRINRIFTKKYLSDRLFK